jgi:hypothetical protein
LPPAPVTRESRNDRWATDNRAGPIRSRPKQLYRLLFGYRRQWRGQLHGLIDQAHALLDPYGEQTALLKAAATFVAIRSS